MKLTPPETYPPHPILPDEVWGESDKPCTLPNADPREVAMEWDKLKRPQWRGTAKEL